MDFGARLGQPPSLGEALLDADSLYAAAQH
jgi:hypothetical protein